MSTPDGTSIVAGTAPRLALALNASCQCIWLDREQLRRQLEQILGDGGQLLDSRPGLAAGSVVFVDPEDAEAMDRTAALIRRALTSPVYLRHVERHAPPIARSALAPSSGVLGLDFHLGGRQPQLIEINTNPGGLLVNLALARALTADCECMTEPLAGLASGSVALEDLPSRIATGFAAEWASVRGSAPLTSIAIVDDDPAGQYLYPEFQLYQRLLAQSGWTTRIIDAGTLEYRDRALVADGQRIDLVYNRVTDFYFAEERHSALRHAYESGAAVITPHPAGHAHWADKRLLAWLRDATL